MMRSVDFMDVVIGIVIICSVLGINASIFYSGKNNEAVQTMQAEAIEHGYGYWQVNKDGSTTFKWKGGKINKETNNE